MSILTTADDIRNDALRMAGELSSSDSEFYDNALDYLNQWHRDILSGATDLNVECGDPWIWARSPSPGVLNLQPKQTYTVAVTKGSSSGTLSLAPTGSLQGLLMRVQGTSEFYRVKTHISGQTGLTLDGAYTDDTATLSADFYTLEYTLDSSILRLCAPMRVFKNQAFFEAGSGRIEGIDESALDRDFPLHMLQESTPDRFSATYQDASGIRIRINKSPAVITRCEYDFIPMPVDLTATDSPLIPKQHRKVLSYCVAYQICHDKNDSRKDEYRELAKAALTALATAYRKSKSSTSTQFGRVIPRRDMMGRRFKYWGI